MDSKRICVKRPLQDELNVLHIGKSSQFTSKFKPTCKCILEKRKLKKQILRLIRYLDTCTICTQHFVSLVCKAYDKTVHLMSFIESYWFYGHTIYESTTYIVLKITKHKNIHYSWIIVCYSKTIRAHN